MVYANRTFQEWAAMTPWQRDDFSDRFAKYQKKQQAELAKQEQQFSVPAFGKFK